MNTQHSLKKSPRYRQHHFGVIFILFLAVTLIVPASAEIYFAAKPMGPASNIYAADESGRITPLTSDNRFRDLMADINGTGDIIFVSDRQPDTAIDMNKRRASFDLFMLKQGESQPTRLSNTPATELLPQFNRQATAAAFIEKGQKSDSLKVIDIQSRQTSVLATADAIPHFSWSPDGKTLAYAAIENSKSKINSIKNHEKAAPQTLVELRATDSEEGAAEVITYAQWSPDGDKIAYIVGSTGSPARVLRVRTLASGEDVAVSAEDIHVQQPVAWHDDNQTLLFSALVDFSFHYDERAHRKVYQGAMHLFIANNDQVRQITDGKGAYKNPIFSPDGERIACLYGDSLNPRELRVRVLDHDGSTLKEVYSGVAKNSFLHWKHRSVNPAKLVAQ